MTGIFRASAIYRAGACVCGRAFGAFARAWRASRIRAAFDAVARVYQASGLKRFLDRAFGRPSSAFDSFYARLLGALGRVTLAIGRAYAHSIIYRAGIAIGRKIKPVWDASLLCRAISRAGMKGLLIIAMAMYLPLDYAARIYVGGIAASLWDEVFLVFAFLFVVFRRRDGRVALRVRATPLDTPILLFFSVFLMLTLINSPNMAVGIEGFRAVCQFCLWFFIATRLFETEKDLMLFAGAFAVMLTAVSLHGIYQYIIGAPIPSNWLTQTEMGVRTRVFSISGSPNIMGSLMILAFGATAGFIWHFKRPAARLIAAIAAGCACLGCLFTFSRGAWLGLGVAALLFLIMASRRLIPLLVAVAAGAAALVPSVANRISFLFTSDFTRASDLGGRGLRWEVGSELFQAHPWIGFGLGRFGGAVAANHQDIEGMTYFYLDNYYLKTLVEGGVIGLAAISLVFLVFLWQALKISYAARNKLGAPVLQGLACGVLGVLVHCFTENVLEVPYMNAYVFIVMAAVMAFGLFYTHTTSKTRRF